MKKLGGGQQRDTAAAAFNATQFAACPHTIVVDGIYELKVAQPVLEHLIKLLQIREHDGHMFAHELKADEQ